MAEIKYADLISLTKLVTNVKNLLSGKVATSRKINGKALTADITLSASDVGADSKGSAASALTEAKSYTDIEIASLVGTAPETLNTLEELAAAIDEHQDVTDALDAAISNKVDKVSGKGLSTNDYTTTEKNKLAGIAEGADAVSFSGEYTEGTKIGSITINGTATDIYTPEAGESINATISTTQPTGDKVPGSLWFVLK